MPLTPSTPKLHAAPEPSSAAPPWAFGSVGDAADAELASDAALEGEWLSAQHGRLVVRDRRVWRSDFLFGLLLDAEGGAEGQLRLHLAHGEELALNTLLSTRSLLLWHTIPELGGPFQGDTWDRRLIPAISSAFQEARRHFPGLAQDLSLLDLAAPPLRRSIGFCTTCKNRLWQLRVALPINLLYAWPFRLSVTLHIVDFGSDGEGGEGG